MFELESLDAVVLAGGKSERLRGIVPAYYKPFIVVGGRSLLVAAVEDALAVGAERVVVVAAGENALLVFQLVGHHSEVRVVLADGGPARALLTGLEVCTNERVLVLMSDNVQKLHTLQEATASQYSIGVQNMTCADAARFTRIEFNRWVEGSTPDNHGCKSTDPHTRVWCGPLVISRKCALTVLPDEEKIGPLLAELAPHATYVETRTVDAGTPDVVKQLT